MDKYEKMCFVIMPISDKQGYPSGHFTNVYEQIFKPAIIEAGFEPYRVDEDALSSSIIQKIYDGLSKAKMAICDLSSANPNVLYELGIRHSFDLPVVLVKDERTDFIFDISPINTIVYHSDRVYENVISARDNIKEAIMEMDSQSGKGTLLSVINIQKAVLSDVNISEEDKTGLILGNLLKDVQNIKQILSDKKDDYDLYIVKEGKSPEYAVEVAINNLSSLLHRFPTVDEVLSFIGPKTKHDKINIENIYWHLLKESEGSKR